MRRNYISPEYKYTPVNGTYNMLEQSSFFGSKMLEIEDSISIGDNNIIYYQNINNEQIDISVENSLPSIVYNSSNSKFSNHTLVIDESQGPSQLESNTKWIIEIDLKKIFTEYLFATLKEFRTFEGVKNNMTSYNDINFAINEYIFRNVLDRYKYSSIDLFISYRDIRNQNLLRYKNDWNLNMISDTNKVKRIQTDTAFDESKTKIMFTQEKPSNQYSFEYYFNLNYLKI